MTFRSMISISFFTLCLQAWAADAATGAFRYTDARTTYDTGMLRHRPLTSSYKALLTLSYATPMKIWQFDLTGQLNGHGTLYDNSSYPTYFHLQAQTQIHLCRLCRSLQKDRLLHHCHQRITPLVKRFL